MKPKVRNSFLGVFAWIVISSCGNSITNKNTELVTTTEVHSVDTSISYNFLPDINGVGLNDENISIRSIKSKYILLEFWASWCPPCRGFNPDLVKVYDKYHASGFEIFSISLDHEPNKWKAAVKKDNLHWSYHMCEFRGWGSYWAKQYTIEEIPNNILFDQNGNIIARGMEPDDLDAKLKTLFPSK